MSENFPGKNKRVDIFHEIQRFAPRPAVADNLVSLEHLSTTPYAERI
ncbi:hypothetical protein PQQ96_19010 [Paraburkholderia sediminicola]